ncbi:hypothetical protein [Bradyrhizobium sp. SZCCHNRI1073]|uniref:hypothetical protein n=1 Tax=Bradyrhizobium sp. SZCCHNRI1073 TaxID=3057280 RepID=UPI002916F4F3|nr:hypothetical protein [Bradyrhizobium sp. SZCCHNRI1073]
MYERAERAHGRFHANLTRIQSMFGVAFTRDKNAHPNGSFNMEAASGDILRATVVFLHASTEDYIRSHIPRPDRFTYTSEKDILKALRKNSYDSSSLAPFLPHLADLAERRNRIVHHADLPDTGTVSDWTGLDTADLTIWLIAVWGFSWQLLSVVTKPQITFLERAEAFKSSLAKAVDFKTEFAKMIASAPIGGDQASAMDSRLIDIFLAAHPSRTPPELRHTSFSNP